MEQLAIAGSRFNCMAYCMAVVEMGANPRRFLLILFDNTGLDCNIAGNQGSKLFPAINAHDVIQHVSVTNCGVFDDFCKSLVEFTIRQ